MASQISSTRPTTDGIRRRAFTLIEVMVAAVLSGIVLSAAFSAFLMIARSSYVQAAYSDLDTQARSALETFSRDARMANKVDSCTSTALVLGVSDNSSSRAGRAYTATYTYDANQHAFIRTVQPSDATLPATTAVLMSDVREITAGAGIFAYYHYVNMTHNYGDPANATTTPMEVKQVEISFVAQRTRAFTAKATNKVLSARFILRNK